LRHEDAYTGKRAIADIVTVGKTLTKAKKRGGHGHFTRWLMTEFPWSEGTA
jgi:hypothetical protein